jgi:hypothetical protein
MDELQKKIENMRAELEKLYLKVKSGEPRMEEVLRMSGELDRLLLERSSVCEGAAQGKACS